MANKNYMRLDANFDDLLVQINKAGGKIEAAAQEALLESAKPVYEDMKSFINNHRKTGLTESSLREPIPRNIEEDINRIVLRVGFDIKKGGLPAMFLEYGTPRQKAQPFIQPAIERNRAKSKKIQRKYLTHILEELKK